MPRLTLLQFSGEPKHENSCPEGWFVLKMISKEKRADEDEDEDEDVQFDKK